MAEGKAKTRRRWIAGAIVLIILILALLFRLTTRMTPPGGTEELENLPQRSLIDSQHYYCEGSWLRLNQEGLWEMYLEGNALELGLRHGALASELIHFQEEVFVARLQEMIPSDFYLGFLKRIVLLMNRKIDQYVPEDLQLEIYGISRYAYTDFDFIGDPYSRILSYHAAHDLGHALQNMNLVACTALGVKGDLSSDGALLAGRNFDFSMGPDFARNKVVAFYRPDKGYAFASITWASMTGVLSGMNEKGLVISLNAAKTQMPGSSKMPVSILARQILQHASTIEEALAIAEKAETYVAESFFISSAIDGANAVIEKRPDQCALYCPDGELLVLTNHFQSEAFRNSELTLQNLAEGASAYRWERTRELALNGGKHTPASMARLLRDQKGLGGKEIGMGNEKAINQLIAHHSAIFRPEELLMWVSSSPFQLGSYKCYDLRKIFGEKPGIKACITRPEEKIEADSFLLSSQWDNFRQYGELTSHYRELMTSGEASGISSKEVEAYLELNPEYYYTAFIAAELHQAGGRHKRAGELYRRSLGMEIPRTVDREQVEEALEHMKSEIISEK